MQAECRRKSGHALMRWLKTLSEWLYGADPAALGSQLTEIVDSFMPIREVLIENVRADALARQGAAQVRGVTAYCTWRGCEPPLGCADGHERMVES
jgi:hypothetical protein